MRKYPLRVLIALITFAMGTAVAFTANRLLTVEIDPSTTDEAGKDVQIHMAPRFSPWGRGCGNGYVQVYETDDGQRVAEGVNSGNSRRAVRREFRERIRDAKQIAERARNYRNYRGEFGERVVLINRSEFGESVSVLWYDGGDSYSFIDAPTLDLALEFEQYLIDNDSNPPF